MREKIKYLSKRNIELNSEIYKLENEARCLLADILDAQPHESVDLGDDSDVYISLANINIFDNYQLSKVYKDDYGHIMVQTDFYHEIEFWDLGHDDLMAVFFAVANKVYPKE